MAGITPRHHANLDSARWKLQKTHQHASLYSERIRRVRTDLYLPGDNWQDPKVLMMSGTIQSPLDDVMLGMAIPTFEALKIRMSTLGNRETGGVCLRNLLDRRTRNRYRIHLVFCLVSRLPWLVSKVVKPRDFLLLSTSGIITTADGERIGYDLLQPAPLPQYGNVDMYVQQYVEALGSVIESFVINHTWQAFFGFLSSPLLFEHKRLRWCIANTSNARRRWLANTGDSMSCVLCSVAFDRAVYSRGNDQQSCVLCLASVCSHCREERVFKVLERQPKKKHMSITKRQVHVCRPCLEFVRRHKPADIARHNSMMDRLTPASNSTGDDNDFRKLSWGLLDSDSMPTWSPSRSLSMPRNSPESFG
ncbi:unnamed protein product [Peronospora belbahrii]|uniref:FYVE-type domain-containing protein n=1 Tax=Peronospora belbahrii TaxID=622444 RepID=A0ABN8CQ13_9STRA|nr:unnamed protein product [Peronospora belbahrii]